MLSARHFTFPFAARTRVASDGMIKSTAPTHRAITQHHDMSVVGVHAVQKRCLSQIESVSNHDLMPHSRKQHRGPRGQDCAFVGGFTSQRKLPGSVNGQPARMLANEYAEGTRRSLRT